MLQAPTGSGKTEVVMRVAVDTILAGDGYVVVLAPTRDLIRQHVTYFTERLAGTGLGVGQIHGGAAPAERRETEDGLTTGAVRVVVGSAMLLTIDRYWHMIDAADLVIIDDVNAFDEREHLRLLEDIDAPMIFATAERVAQLSHPRRRVQERRADAQDAVQRAADQGAQDRGRVG